MYEFQRCGRPRRVHRVSGSSVEECSNVLDADEIVCKRCQHEIDESMLSELDQTMEDFYEQQTGDGSL